MKNFITTLILIGFIISTNINASTKEVDKCRIMADTAKLIMNARQNGRSLRDIISILEKHGAGEMSLLAKMAYSKPRYMTPNNKKRAIAEFENTIYLMCLKASNKG